MVWLSAAGVIAAGAMLFVVDPSRAGFLPPCPFNYLTHLYCPGCGTMRGLHQLLHGNVLAAVDRNPLMMISLPFVGYEAVSWAKGVLTGREFPKVFRTPGFAWAVLGIVMAYWVLRNIPSKPFTFLAP